MSSGRRDTRRPSKPIPTVLESLHPDQQRAIAAALEASQPGDVISVHTHDCPISAIAEPTDEDMEGCGCQPLTFTVGAEA